MSAFEWNKVIGAILVALLVIKVADIAGDAALHAKVLAKPAYPIAGVTPAKTTTKVAKAAPVKIPAIGPLLAKASVDEGKKVARKCAICHNFEKGAGTKIGPDLWNVVGRTMGQGDNFNFSDAMKKKGAKIDYKTLNHFLYDPQTFVPGTKMTFTGVKDPQERADVIAFLRTLSDNPKPLP